VLQFLLLQVRLQFLILLLSDDQAVLSVVAELFDQLKSLNCLSFDLTVVALHCLQVVAQFVQLAVQQVFQEAHVLSL